MMSTQTLVEDQYDDEVSRQAVDALELALFLSAVSRDRPPLLTVANSLCLGGKPPIGWDESVWLSALRQLDARLNEWMSDCAKPASLADLLTDVPLDSGIFSLEEFRDRLTSGISEGEAIQALADEVELDNLTAAYRDDDYVLLRDGRMEPQLLISFDRPSSGRELVVAQTIGFRPTTARLRVERDWVIRFDLDGIAKLDGEHAAKLWGKIAQLAKMQAPSEMQHLASEEGMTQDTTADGILNQLGAAISANLAEVKRFAEDGIRRAMVLDFAQLILPIPLSALNSGREMLFTAQNLITNIPAAPRCRVDVTVWRKQKNDEPWLDLHIELASRRRTGAAVELLIEWDDAEAATKWYSLTSKEPLLIDIREKTAGKLSVVVR